MKRVSYILVIFFIMFLGIVKVDAIATDKCINNGTCIVACDYSNTEARSGSGFAGKYRRDITLYYMVGSTDFKLVWKLEENEYPKYKGPNAISYIFSNSSTNVYNETGKDITYENFTCPKNAYIDTLGNIEICFDNDGTSCANNRNDSYTKFGSANSKIVSTTGDNTFERDIKNYMRNIVEDVKYDITAGKFNAKTELTEKMSRDFEKNYLHGQKMPAFIDNNAVYKSMENEAYKYFEETKAKETERIDKACENGEMTQQECDEAKANWDVSEEDIKKQVQKFYEIQKVDVILDFDTSKGCASYLGTTAFVANKSVQDPAYYLQFLFNLVKYAALILLFVLTAVEFGKAMVSNNQDAMKKAINNTFKRIIIAIIIFFLPILIEFIFQLLGIYSAEGCGIS